MNFHLISRQLLAAFVLASWVLGLTLSAQAQQTAKPQPVASIEGITEYRLNNGVRYLLFPDASSSKVTVNMTVMVGSRHEGYGETGMAHLLEHMLFLGSKEFPTPDKELQKRGADYNGTTYVDRTNYYETMAGTDDNLEFAIRLEADRLVNCFIRREDLLKEMKVVRNEFERGENNPEGILSQRMMAVAFEWHNYGKSTIGNRSDIERVPIERLQAFYRKYYQPDNVMLVVAGKFDEMKAHAWISKYFGPIPRPTRQLEATYTQEPPQDGERTVILRRVGTVAVAGVVYHTPAAAHPDCAAIDVLETVLTAQPFGRLYKALVETKKASAVYGFAPAWHDPAVLEVLARVSDQSTPEEVRDIMLGVIEGIAKNPITPEEVDRARARFLSSWEQTFARSQSIAIQLSEWASAGDWRLMFLHRDRIKQMTAQQVNEAAKKYLQQSNRTVGLFLPAKEIARAEIPDAPDVEALVRDYKGGQAIASGEQFDPTPDNIEKRTRRGVLSSGVKYALLPKKTRGETVVARMSLHFGNEDSLRELRSAAQFLGPLMIRGTEKFTRQEIQDQLDKMKASLSLSSGTGTLSVGIQAKRDTLPAVLDLLEEVLRRPTFPEKEFEILQRNSVQGIKRQLTEPGALASNLVQRKLHPYPPDSIHYVPTMEESIKRLEAVKRDDVVRLYREQLGASVGEIAIVGDFDPDASVKRLEKVLAGWKASVPYKRITAEAITTVKGSRDTIDTPDKQNAVHIAGLTLKMTDTDPQYPAMTLGNYILGGAGFTAILMDRLRTKEGISYGAGSRFSADSQDKYATFYLFASLNPMYMEKVDRIVLEVLNEVVKKGITTEQLELARKGYLEESANDRGSDSTIANTLREGLYLGRTYHFEADFEKRIAQLTLAEVNAALRALLDTQRLVIVRAGDLKKVPKGK